jgi:hypothetical protein
MSDAESGRLGWVPPPRRVQRIEREQERSTSISPSFVIRFLQAVFAETVMCGSLRAISELSLFAEPNS